LDRFGGCQPFFSIYFYRFFHLQNRWDTLGHAASCAEAAAKDLRNVPRGRVASLMESWEEDGIRFPALPGILCNWGTQKTQSSYARDHSEQDDPECRDHGGSSRQSR
jgi:hypothetical protein